MEKNKLRLLGDLTHLRSVLNEDKKFLTPKEAMSLLNTYTEDRKVRVHTFSLCSIAIIGCGMDLARIKRILANAKEDEIKISIDRMRNLSHGVSVWTKKDGWLYIETDEEKLKEFYLKRKLVW